MSQQEIKPHNLSGVAALAAAMAARPLRKMKGEKDTAFVKRVAAAYLDAHLKMSIDGALKDAGRDRLCDLMARYTR